MDSIMKKVGWFIFAFLAIGVGLYPSFFIFTDMSHGLLGAKSEELRAGFWSTAFYLHILLGGLSLLTGWSQFSSRIRNKFLNFHRNLGKVYVAAVGISGISGLYIAFFAEGGPIAQWGFTFLAIFWLFTTSMAFLSIRAKKISEHQKWMIRSYALTFAAVTLRIYLPLFEIFTDLQFVESYRIIAWICWVPNIILAELFIRIQLTTNSLYTN